MKARFAFIALICCLVIPMLSTVSWLQYRRGVLRRESMQLSCSSSGAQTFVLLKLAHKDLNQLNWKDDREFEYKNQMFDIVETETSTDTTFFWCKADHEETRVRNSMRDILSFLMGKEPFNKESSKRLQNFNKSLYCQRIPEYPPLQRELKHELSPFSLTGNSVFVSPPSPPPKAS